MKRSEVIYKIKCWLSDYRYHFFNTEEKAELILNGLEELGMRPPSRVAYYTIDGNLLCPYPGMTNEELWDYERAFNIPKTVAK